MGTGWWRELTDRWLYMQPGIGKVAGPQVGRQRKIALGKDAKEYSPTGMAWEPRWQGSKAQACRSLPSRCSCTD